MMLKVASLRMVDFPAKVTGHRCANVSLAKCECSWQWSVDPACLYLVQLTVSGYVMRCGDRETAAACYWQTREGGIPQP
jgi:hypothetical protein